MGHRRNYVKKKYAKLISWWVSSLFIVTSAQNNIIEKTTFSCVPDNLSLFDMLYMCLPHGMRSCFYHCDLDGKRLDHRFESMRARSAFVRDEYNGNWKDLFVPIIIFWECCYRYIHFMIISLMMTSPNVTYHKNANFNNQYPAKQ